MLPDAYDLPSGSGKLLAGVAVALNVAGELGRPPICIGFRDRAVVGTCVPEATVYEHRYALSSEYDVRRAPQARQGSSIHAITQASGMKQPANGDLGGCIAGGLSGQAATRRLIRGRPFDVTHL